MDAKVLVYTIYLAVCVGLTIWVGQKLYRTGRLFLVDVFHGDLALADSVNHLLLVGFYLVNLGYISLTLRIGGDVTTLSAGIEALSGKVGLVLLGMGVMHFGNLFLFSLARRSLLGQSAPAIQPSAPARAVEG